MFIAPALAALAFASAASAHATVYGVWVDDVFQGDGRSKYIRSPPNNNPVKDLASADIACNVNGATAGTSFVTAAAGSKVTFEWYHDNRADDIIAASHQGPVIHWIAPYTTADGTGAIWTKIAEEGYDATTKKWAVDNLIANKGKVDITVPASLAAGKYLIKSEIIAHHESETTYDVNSARGAQFYPSCAQFEITGSGSAVPDQNFDFNTGYTYADPGIKFNIYGAYTSYSIPGPDVWSGSSSGGTTPAPTTTKAAVVSSTSAPVASSAAAVVSSAPAVVSSAAAVPTTLVTSAKPTSAAAATKTSSAGTTTPTTKPCNKSRKARRHARKH